MKLCPGSQDLSYVVKELDMEATEKGPGVMAVGNARCTQSWLPPVVWSQARFHAHQVVDDSYLSIRRLPMSSEKDTWENQNRHCRRTNIVVQILFCSFPLHPLHGMIACVVLITSGRGADVAP